MTRLRLASDRDGSYRAMLEEENERRREALARSEAEARRDARQLAAVAGFIVVMVVLWFATVAFYGGSL